MMDVTFEQVEAEVRRLAEENPDFVYDKGCYPVCRYNADEHQPGCIFGQALANLKSPVTSSWESRPIRTILKYEGVNLTDRDEVWSSIVQNRQDNKMSWGEAVKAADDYLAEYGATWEPIYSSEYLML